MPRAPLSLTTGATGHAMAAPTARRRTSPDELSLRDADIRELRADGRTVPELARLTGLDARSIRRICVGVAVAIGRGPIPVGELRQDRRRNGRLYAAWEPETHDDSLDLDAEEGA